ncbi:MAG: hypothetical protein ACM3MK_12460, partial [Chitinophagales bacterium]
NVGKGKDIEKPVVFQGGVAANRGLRKSFAKLLGFEVEVPRYYAVMGAVGAALLAAEEGGDGKSSFRGSEFILDGEFQNRSWQCQGCPNQCEVVSIKREKETLAYWGDRCRRWEQSLKHSTLPQ